MNSLLSMLQSIVYKVHSLSTDLNRKFVQRSVNGIWKRSRVEAHCLSIGNAEKDSTDHVSLGL